MLEKFRTWLSGPDDGRKLGFFRAFFGAMMVVRMLKYYQEDFIGKGILAPKLHFTFDGFEWVRPLPNGAMQAILFAMLVASLLLMLGRWMRAACAVLMAGSWYFLFLEKAYFNNHLYLFVLLYFLLMFTEADRFLAWGGKPSEPREVPRWQVFILGLQVMVVYFFGGVAKLNPDWLFRQEPVRSMLNGGMWAGNEAAIQFFNIGGLAIDILAPILLWWRPARRWAVWAFVFFHVTNSINFHDIGVFPFVMIGALVLYLDSDELGWLWRLLGLEKKGASPAGAAELSTGGPVFEKPARWAVGLLLVHFAFQLLFPLRGYFLPNPQDFTTIGNRFSWHMKIDNRAALEPVMTGRSVKKGRDFLLPLGEILNNVQIAHLATDPRSVVQVARFAHQTAADKGLGEIEVYSHIHFSYNGRPPQDFLDPKTDLAKATVDPLRKIDWLVLPGR